MKKHLIKGAWLVAIALILSSISVLIFPGVPFIVTLINRTFMLSLIMLMIGGAFFVLEGGMFNAIITSFKQFFKRMSKTREWIDSQTFEDHDDPVSFSFGMTKPLLLAGGLLFIITFIWSFSI